MTLITEPSRTVDIDLVLIIGVHGHERLDTIVA